ncbi:Lipoprotein signal peptidase [Moritella sp. JT01]|uniref:signal peptidase II n=1 Tax=Moritella sp. JT01 TaxID=756698 RepID=UPI000795EE58|nr:signal peptidase II [Moritella sp. JT01]KXO13536.1 Lipoprotein signal peptidase [Moritella sp. JT01]
MTVGTHKRTGLIWLWLAVVVFFIDLGTKTFVVSHFQLGESVNVLPVFNFTYARNYGAAFSMFADAGGWQRWFFGVIAVSVSGLLIYWLKKQPAQQYWSNIAYALILGGALGNLYDRIIHGYVIDFLHVYWDTSHFPIFNLADTWICIGAAMLILEAIMESKNDKESSNDS